MVRGEYHDKEFGMHCESNWELWEALKWKKPVLTLVRGTLLRKPRINYWQMM